MEKLCDDIQKPGLQLLYSCGFGLTESSFGLYVFNLALHLAGYILLMLNSIFAEYHSFEDIIKLSHNVSFICFFLPLIELILNRKNNLVYLVGIKSQFWSLPSEVEEPELRHGIFEIVKKYKVYFLQLQVILVLGAVSVLPAKLLWEQSSVVFYQPRFFSNTVQITFEVVVKIAFAIFSVGITMLYCSLLIPLSIQFKLLNKRIETVFDDIESKGEEKCVVALRGYIEHHGFLIRSVKILNSTFSATLLIWQWDCVIYMSILLFELSRDAAGTDPMAVIHVIGVAWELFFFYFLPSQLLTDEASRLPESIYNSNWTETKLVSTRKTILIVTAMAQKDVVILAGGYIPMNMETCTNVFNNMLTFRTYLASFTE